jgi:phosphoribosylglycinamide formyltransferase 2
MLTPGASAVISADWTSAALPSKAWPAPSGPRTDLRLFGKPEAYVRRRMRVALAYGPDVNDARERAKLCASRVRPVTVAT